MKNKHKIDYDFLNPIQKGLLHSANLAMNNAYNLYSELFVGSALVTKVGDTDVIISGVNVENVSFPVTCCAERGAISSLFAAGHKNFYAIAVIARPGQGKRAEIISPCGMCRQAIVEFADASNDIEVIMSNTDMTQIEIWKISELLPLSFRADNLKK
jgi:cytidine deaminase